MQLLFGNTYHLHLRPGEDIVAKMGGLAKFIANLDFDGIAIGGVAVG